MTDRSAGTTHPNAPLSVTQVAPLALHFVYPAEVEGLVIELEPKTEIGREAAAGDSRSASVAGSGTYAVVPHATVSRRHAAVGESIGNIPTLIDRGGRNGTFLDGRPVSGSVALLRHSVVRFGEVLAIVDERATADSCPTLPGRSPAMARLREVLPRVASDAAAVLIVGETGTGKEVVASEVHRRSGRQGPLLKFNCAELSQQLVESQLFGHERGAYTGATAAHAGLFVAADGGTLFLDEVAEIPLELQAKLLRVLQDGEVRPLGSVRARRVDVRVVCATNANLLERVQAGSFRRDLLARLSYLELGLPPLRERKQDILPWVDHFRARWCEERRSPGKLSFRPQAAELILNWSWPDNLRGLNRLVHRILTASTSSTVEVGVSLLSEAMPEMFAAASEFPSQPPAAARQASERPGRDDFLAVYESSGRSVRATAKHFGRDRKQIYRWLEAFGVERAAGDEET
jgi:transcriptional regulator with GAF, ATPase, and Fis domain